LALFEKIVELARKEHRPLDLHYIAEKLGHSWSACYKAIFDKLLEHLQQENPEVLTTFPLFVVKTRKSLVILPRELLAGRNGLEAVRTGEAR
jgi:hypothetical protein